MYHMSGGHTSNFQMKSGLLVFLFLAALCSPMMENPSLIDALEDDPDVRRNAPFSLSSGYGHDLAGTTVNVDGLVNAVVREESMFDSWMSHELNNSSVEHHGTPDMELTRHDNEHYCWSTEEGPVRTATYRPSGQWTSSLVDNVAASNASELVDCAVGVTANELKRVLYVDGDDLKIGRYARESATYYDGPRWHTRTIFENVSPTNLALDITPDGLEWGLMRTTDGVLHQVNFSGAYWTHFILDNGPVGADFELEIDETGIAHILYSRTAENEVVLMRVDGMERDVRVLLRDANLFDGLGMGLDSNHVEQIATSTQTGNSFSINLIRSLSGQETGRIDPVPLQEREGEVDVDEGVLLMADLNHDGYDDLVISTPQADLLGLTHNGRVDIFYGSSDGLALAPDAILAGDSDGAHFGLGMDVGDFNNDGIFDLAVGVPGWKSSNLTNETDGQVLVYLGSNSGVSSLPWAELAGDENESLGSVVRTLALTGQGDGLAASAHGYQMEVSSSKTDTGKVNVFAGGENGMTHVRNLTQTKNGDMFGRSLEGCDVNNDGFEELIVGNTGSFEDSLSYSSVEYFYGSSSGYDGTPDHTLEPLSSGKLFGIVISCIGDVDGDGYNEHIIAEPFNASAGFGTGTLWLFNGTNASLSGGADWQYEATTPNSRIGEAVAPAGDVNEDGFDDVFISSRMGSSSGRLELFLGSATGLRTDQQLLAEGSSNERLGRALATQGDLNGDGLNDLVYSKRDQTQGATYGLHYSILTERDWEYIAFDYTGTLQDLDLATAARGETSIAFSHFDGLRAHANKLEHMNDGTPSGQWVSQTIATSNVSHLALVFSVRSSGQPVLLVEDGSSFDRHSTESMTAVQQDIVTSGTMGQYLGSTVGVNNEQVVAYTSGAGKQIYVSEQTATGWNTGLVRTNADLAQPIETLVDSTGTPHLVYRHNTTMQLELASGGSSWNLAPLGDEGDAVSIQHPAIMLNDDSVAVALVDSDGNGTNLSLWTYDGSSLSKQSIANQSDANVQIGLAQRTNGSLLVASLTSNGVLGVHEQWPGHTTWQHHTLAQPSGTNGEYRLDLQGGDHPVLAIRGNAISSIMMLNETNVWQTVAERPAAAVDGAWDVLHLGDSLVLMTSDPVTQHLIFNTVELNGTHDGHAPWMSVQFGDVVSHAPVNAMLDSNGTIHMAYWETVNDDVIVLRLYEDQDRDLVFDLIDSMPSVGNQWLNTDGDNFGDNPYGPLPDACPTVSGPSSFVIFGCADFDMDGYTDTIDGCDDEGGTSWIDRFGCEDLDQDGWSDNDAIYFDGDVFKGNWKQALDTDGDGFGDNHGVDCCATPLDPNANSGDLFPYYASQYSDYDEDGYGDNDTDTVYGDYCPWNYGESYRDRNGCLDSDGDGSSDPSGEGTFLEWNATVHGADAWPLDPTQWQDTDGDGFGDNQSENATLPDRFPFRKAAANDTDLDGYANNWTSSYNGTNAEGIQLDACPDVWGNSTFPVVGCLDSDGDLYTDQYSYVLNEETNLRENQAGDTFPFIESQWMDTDGDGFGDNPNGYEADECPYEAGVVDGTNGLGCRLIDLQDNDGDGLINDLDTLCPNSPPGESVNQDGCAQSELDDDDDGVKNNLDLCPGTPPTTGVDSDGCSNEQRTSDSDGDGLNDPQDACPNTQAGQNVDSQGCSQAQRDSDGDGLSDLDDACDDTPPGFPILANGCTDESALDIDLDGDGYAGKYAYDLDPETGLHTNMSGDAFPSDPTQWFDRDGDGYGDNANGTNADDCPSENGTSYIDFLGCLDDGDGWRDENEPASLRGDATQWQDSDFDGYGDNWGDPSWNDTRDPAWPGQFVSGATNADFCPKTTPGLTVGEDGCHISERDTDGDGVMDDYDICPNVPKGVDGFADGCPFVPASGDGEEGLFGVDAGTLMVALGGGGLFLVVVAFIVIRLTREEDDDDDEDDYEDFFDDDDDEKESFLDTLDKRQAAPMRSRPAPARSTPAAKGPSSPPSRGGPSSGPPPRGTGGPPKRQSGGPPPRAAPPSASKKPATAAKVAKKKSVPSASDEPATKVRKAKINVDMDVFDDGQEEDREAAVDWVVGAFADGDEERTVLMQLQETGWTAQQSRAICSLARNKGA